jgi:Mrp family chromosome partitioning ATPase
MPSEKEMMEALTRVMDPELGRNIVELGMVHDLKIDKNGQVSLTVKLTVPGCPMREQIGANTRSALIALPGVKSVDVAFGAMSEEERRAIFGKAGQPGLPKLNQFNQVKQVIAIMSGKGGVGKSSVTSLLAAGLRKNCQTVGILDADITGPSIPKLFGLKPGGVRGGEQGMLPAVTASGIKVMSVNLLLKEEDTPVIWRGPVVSGVIQQFWNEVLWGKLDFLLVDLPPGTSDAALTVLQSLPVTGVILVSTPQELAALVVRKAIHMIEQLNIPIVGVVENMSYFSCPESGKPHYIFGPSHVEEIASTAGVAISARLPIDPLVATLCDAGKVEEVELAEVADLVKQVEALKV